MSIQMLDEQVIIAGFGGQGVMMMGKLLAHAGMIEHRHVTWLPSYGPEMRGGTANCHVIVSEHQIGSPVIAESTATIAMNLPSLDKFERVVKPGGLLLINSSLVERTPTRTDVNILEIPVNDMANQQGSLRVANMVMLGAYVALSHVVKKETIIAALQEVLGATKQHLLGINVRALEEGIAFATTS